MKRPSLKRLAGLSLPLAVSLVFAGPAAADLTVGVSLALTGPGSALGIPVKNGFDLWPAEIGGEKVRLIILDDTGDPSQATRNARKFATEEKVDVMLGSTQTPGGMAVATVANETQTVHMAFAPIPLSGDKTAWSFVVPQSVTLMANGVVKDIKEKKFKTLGIIGFSDPWGEQWYEALAKGLEGSGTKIVANEKYGRADTSVTGQVLKLISANPDAILVAGSGTGAALPQTALAERGYKGQVYQTHGAGSSDFLRIAGKSAEKAILPIGPVLVPKQLPDSHPSKKVVQTFIKDYQAKFGDKSPVVFGAHSYDAWLILQRVVPVAKEKAKPGTPEFRKALRDALESQKDIAAVNGVYSFSAQDHYGLDERGAVMVAVTNGAVYALLGIAIVLVFAVTRIIFVPQGEFVAYGALTLASLQAGMLPGSVWLLLVVAATVAVLQAWQILRYEKGVGLPGMLARTLGLPLLIAGAAWWLAPMQLPLPAQVLLTLAIITPLGPLLYRAVFQPIADASVLVLLIASVALHFALTGLALVFFGAEGFRTPAFSDTGLSLGALNFSGQSLWIYGVTLVLIVAMGIFFAFTLQGKALRATAFNRTGARLIGFSPTTAGLMTFTFAAFLGTLSGVLIAPIITVYYDSGFIIGLKGFVAAIVGGLASYPMTALGAILVGCLEAFSSFWASGYKEVIVFTLIIPVLIWLSLTSVHHEEEEH